MSAVPPLIPGSQMLSTLEVDKAKINTLFGEVLYKLNSWKGTVMAATTGNVLLLGLSAIDGFTPIKGDRILVKDQSDPIQNGIYVADLLAWKRSDDLPVGSFATGVAVFVVNGTIDGDRIFVCTNSEDVDVVGTDPLVFSELLASSSSVGLVNQIQVSAGADLPVVNSLATATPAGAISTPVSITAGTTITGNVVASTTSMAAGTTMTAGTGFVATAGGLSISTKVSGAIPGTVNGFSGTLTTSALAIAPAGTLSITVSNSNVSANSRIFLQINTYTGAGTPILYVTSIGSTTFDITVTNIGALAINNVITMSYLIV